MRIVYVGNFEPEYSTENDVRKAFEYLGHEIVQVQENDPHAQQWLQHAFEDGFDLLLITSTWDFCIDLRFMISLVKRCAMAGIPTATLHLDIFFGSDRGVRQWWLNPMFQTAYIFTADGDHQREWQLLGKNHIWLPPGVRHDAAHFGKPRDEYRCDVAFVGSNGTGYHESVWPYRKQLVDYLRDMCRRRGWIFRNPGGEPDRPDWGKVQRSDDLNDFYASAKVTVGDSLCLAKSSSHYWSDRVPEATGRGGFLIMPKIAKLETMYGDMLPMYEWGNFYGLEQMIEAYLADDKGRADVQGYCQDITASKHTYVNRAKTILEKVGLV